MASTWIAYNDLAWTEGWLADPADSEEEALFFVERIRSASTKPPHTMLHLASGAGSHDATFKRHFEVTGVDLSLGMLSRARAAHPDVEYVEGDMRTIRLNRTFDVVAIPDSIDYMTTLDDLRLAIETAVVHLEPGGVLLVVAKSAETFRNNNFAYTAEKEGVHVTVLENNHVDPLRPNTYEAVLLYLIRRGGELTLATDRHVLGLFPRAAWDEVFRAAGLTMQSTVLDGIYDEHLLGDGEYPLTVFVGRKDR